MITELPSRANIASREVIIGGGVHAAIYAATRVAMGYPPPLVLERAASCGGVFGRFLPFWLNSVNAAGLASVLPGPSRVMPGGDSDDLNWLPNAGTQVRDLTSREYPPSDMVAKAVSRTLRECGGKDTYLNAEAFPLDDDGTFTVTSASGTFTAGRLIDARGLEMAPLAGVMARTPGVMTAADFLASRKSSGEPRKVAIIGDGDTAAITAELLLGQAPCEPPFRAEVIGWYGGGGFPVTKEAWIASRQARYLGLARHFPQQDGRFDAPAAEPGVIRPYARRGDVTSLGNRAMVNGQPYDLVIMATGFRPATTVQPTPYLLGGSQDYQGCRRVSDRNYVIGAAAGVNSFSAEEDRLGFSRFSQNTAAIFRLGPRTAQLAASLPSVDQR